MGAKNSQEQLSVLTCGTPEKEKGDLCNFVHPKAKCSAPRTVRVCVYSLSDLKELRGGRSLLWVLYETFLDKVCELV